MTADQHNLRDVLETTFAPGAKFAAIELHLSELRKHVDDNDERLKAVGSALKAALDVLRQDGVRLNAIEQRLNEYVFSNTENFCSLAQAIAALSARIEVLERHHKGNCHDTGRSVKGS